MVALPGVPLVPRSTPGYGLSPLRGYTRHNANGMISGADRADPYLSFALYVAKNFGPIRVKRTSRPVVLKALTLEAYCFFGLKGLNRLAQGNALG